MRNLRQIFIISLFIFSFLIIGKAQNPRPSYGFLEVVDYKNNPVADASVGWGSYEPIQIGQQSTLKTNEKGLLEKGIELRYNNGEMPFSISKVGFYSFIDCFGLFKSLRSERKGNTLKIELLKIPENKAEKKLMEKEQQNREFFLAARKGDTTAVKKFIKSGLSPNLTTSDLRGIPVDKNISIIIYAVKSRNGETVKEFLSAGAKVDKNEEPIKSILTQYLEIYPFQESFPNTEEGKAKMLSVYEDGAISLIDAGAILESKEKGSMTPLMLAAQKYYPRIVRRLIEKGVYVDEETEYGTTALMSLVAYYKQKQRLEIAEILIKAGANVNLLTSQIPTKDNGYGCNTALTIAVLGFDVEMVKLLLANGADVNLTCTGGKSALNYAKDIPNYANNEKTEIIKILTEAGAK